MKLKNMYLVDKIELCDLSIANSCNFKCKMCHFWVTKPPHSRGILTNQDWKNVIDQISQLPAENIKIIFSGDGEVLMRQGIEDLLYYAGRKFLVSLNTNGFLINRHMAEVLAETVSEINISLDGIKSQTHDELRQAPGSFDAIQKAIGYLREESDSLVIIINTVVLKQNLAELEDIVNWVDANRINGVIFQAVTMPAYIPYNPFWYKNDFAFLWPGVSACAVIDRLMEMKRRGSKIINTLRQFECFKEYFSNPESFKSDFRCETERVVKINLQGDIKFCGFSIPVGNIKEQTITQIITSELADKEREKARNCKEPCHLLINCFHDQGGE